MMLGGDVFLAERPLQVKPQRCRGSSQMSSLNNKWLGCKGRLGDRRNAEGPKILTKKV